MRRGWIVALIIVAAVIVAGVVIAVVRATTSEESGNPDAKEWASSVCSSIDDWRTSITSLADVSSGSLTKESLRQKLEDADNATQELVSDLKDLGAPDLEAGDQLKDQLDSDTESLQSSYDSLKSQAQDALDSTSATGFLSSLAALATPFQALVNQISATLQDLQGADDVSADAKAELQQGFDDAESCQKLRSSQD
jgi:hypothetical protein